MQCLHMNHPLGWHGFREDFSLLLLTLPSLSLFLYILTTIHNRLDVNTLFIFNCKMFWEVNYTHIFEEGLVIWLQQNGHVPDSASHFVTVHRVLLCQTCSSHSHECSWCVLPLQAGLCRDWGELQSVCDCYIFSLLCRHMAVSENWLLFHWRLTKALLW